MHKWIIKKGFIHKMFGWNMTQPKQAMGYMATYTTTPNGRTVIHFVFIDPPFSPIFADIKVVYFASFHHYWETTYTQ